MGSNLVLVDSSSWIEALRVRGNPIIRSRVNALIKEARAAWCDMVSVELWHGAKGQQERNILAEMQQTLICFPVGPATWALSRTLSVRLRSAGLNVPAADIIIAACAFENDVPLEHNDRHFTKIEEFR